MLRVATFLALACIAGAFQNHALRSAKISKTKSIGAESSSSDYPHRPPRTTSSGRGRFTYDSDSSIGGGQSAITTTQKQATERGGRGRFTYESDSGIAGGQSAFTTQQKPATVSSGQKRIQYSSSAAK